MSNLFSAMQRERKTVAIDLSTFSHVMYLHVEINKHWFAVTVFDNLFQDRFVEAVLHCVLEAA
jgi:hypothetical protein